MLNELIKEYTTDSEVCMGEFLAYKKVPQGMTFEQAFEMYIKCMNMVEGDEFFVKQENSEELIPLPMRNKTINE